MFNNLLGMLPPKTPEEQLYNYTLIGNHEKMEELITQGADVNFVGNKGNTLLHIAVIKCDLDATRILLKNNAKPDVKNKTGKTPLLIAVENGEKNIARTLVDHGANYHYLLLVTTIEALADIEALAEDED